MSRKRVAILISGRGSNMAALVAAAQDPTYPAVIALVVSNRPNAPGLERARAGGIPAVVVDHTRYGQDREAFERSLQAEVAAQRIDFLCLAGFMRLFTPWFVGQWTERMLNVHPALLPSFKGLDTHRRAIEAGVKIHGATVHLVVPETDAGPIIAQAAIAVHNDDTADTLAERVLALEHRLYPLALGLVACVSSMVVA
jgi:phosphoribosylglycinamide formyltransferase-1